jgi:hypothetical protein
MSKDKVDKMTKTDKVRSVFYKKDKINIKKNQMFTLDEILEAIDEVLPENKYELTCKKNEIRQFIYRVREIERQDNLRELASVKDKGEPVLYGFTDKPEYLRNYRDRMKQHFLNAKKKHDEVGAFLDGQLSLLDYSEEN